VGRWACDGRYAGGSRQGQHAAGRDDPLAGQIGDQILAALQRNPLFVSAALPLKVFPPLFNRYRGGESFGNHVDNAIRQSPVTGVASAPICRPRSSSPSPRNTRAAS
jgi:predicted 2-oxoglutarate/Fe(II)-dependent dioxygenase YbiX